jgi:hypothetical protein
MYAPWNRPCFLYLEGPTEPTLVVRALAKKMSPLSQSLHLTLKLAILRLSYAIPRIGTTVLDDTTALTTSSFRQVRNPDYNFNGAVSIFKTHLKFGTPIPEYLQKAVEATGLLAKRATAFVVATPIDTYDDAYTVPVTIGTPPQLLQLDLDTGSSDLWVFSSQTPSSQVQGQSVYTPNQSSTSKLVSGNTWRITYGDGSSSSGNVYTDNVTIGGLTIRNQAVEVAQKVSPSFTSETSIHGLLGLGFSSLNTVSPNSVATFFDNAKSLLNSPVFTADLRHGAGTRPKEITRPVGHS